MALQEQLTEEEEEARELDERKKELRGKIETQSSDMAQVKRRSMELQRKVRTLTRSEDGSILGES